MKKILTALSIASISYLSAVALTTDKPVYTTTDTIKINFSEMDNHHKDWIGIYPEGSSTAWKNVVKWAWTENKSEGTLTFKNLPAGEYEVKGFYNNSYDAEATKAFKVQGTGAKAELTTTKPAFRIDEDVLINFKNINGATNDWLAIYPADKDNSWGNVVKWKFNKGGVKEGQANFDKLPAGKYEARVFYNNTFKLEGKVAFSVGEVNVDPVEDNTEILKLAKERCLGKDGSTEKLLCSNEENIAYVIKEDPCMADVYQINLQTETVEKFTHEQKQCGTGQITLHKIKNNKLIYITKSVIDAVMQTYVHFYNPNKKFIFGLSYRDDRFPGDTRLESIESIENGTKLKVIYSEYVLNGRDIRWIEKSENHDISEYQIH